MLHFESRAEPAEGLPPGRLRRMLDYWAARAPGGAPPRRRDIDPADFPWALGWCCLIGVERTPLRFRYRLEGTAIGEEDGQRLTGRSIDDIQPPAYAALVRRDLEETLAAAAPRLHRVRIVYDYKETEYHRLSLPLAGEAAGGPVEQILTVATTPRTLREMFERLRRDGIEI